MWCPKVRFLQLPRGSRLCAVLGAFAEHHKLAGTHLVADVVTAENEDGKTSNRFDLYIASTQDLDSDQVSKAFPPSIDSVSPFDLKLNFPGGILPCNRYIASAILKHVFEELLTHRPGEHAFDLNESVRTAKEQLMAPAPAKDVGRKRKRAGEPAADDSDTAVEEPQQRKRSCRTLSSQTRRRSRQWSGQQTVRPALLVFEKSGEPTRKPADADSRYMSRDQTESLGASSNRDAPESRNRRGPCHSSRGRKAASKPSLGPFEAYAAPESTLNNIGELFRHEHKEAFTCSGQKTGEPLAWDITKKACKHVSPGYWSCEGPGCLKMTHEQKWVIVQDRMLRRREEREERCRSRKFGHGQGFQTPSSYRSPFEKAIRDRIKELDDK